MNNKSNSSSNSSPSIKNKLGNMLNKVPLKESIDTKSILSTIGKILVIILVIYILIAIYTYFTSECYEKKSFFKHLFDFDPFNPCAMKDPPLPPKSQEQDPTKLIPLPPSKEVFHISNQLYTFEQAKCKCESYGAQLATKNQLIEAYNKGANWCTYGWTEGQNAFYPVQQCYWDKNKSCGKPGLNGGHFGNPMLKFGVNCYGKKPAGESVNKMKKPYCPPMNFCKLENNYDASHKLSSDEISPFNEEKWSDASLHLF